MLKNGKFTVRDNRTAVLTYSDKYGYIMSQYYHLYYKYFLIKHKPWHGNYNDAWGVPITDPDHDEYEDEEALLLEDDNNSIVKRFYVNQFCSFQQTTDNITLEIVNIDAYRLQRIILECEG